MRERRSISLNEEELLGLRKRLEEEERLEPGDYELIARVIEDAKRLRWRLWWRGHAEAMLRRMLAGMNWLRRCRGKPPLVPEEWDEDE
jgi:hypothetical protein